MYRYLDSYHFRRKTIVPRGGPQAVRFDRRWVWVGVSLMSLAAGLWGYGELRSLSALPPQLRGGKISYPARITSSLLTPSTGITVPVT